MPELPRPKRLLVANRGEIAMRILRSAAELGVETVAVYSEDDADSLHARRADQAHPLAGSGPSPYLDAEQLVSAARETGCDALHPGYGFLSEDPALASRCTEGSVVFVGPTPETLAMLGDKTRARSLAEQCGVPVLHATGPATIEEARTFLTSLKGSPALIKAVAGGGGRGLRVVQRQEDLDEAYARCRSEARQSFGNDGVYVEQLMPRARHVEVQVVGDASGAVRHLRERECTLQRRHQKLVEWAPCPGLPEALRARITADAVRMAEAAGYRNAGTFEFLVDAAARGEGAYAFIEANPRLQVEHTVTEEVLGIDLVRIQLLLAAGCSLAELGLGPDVALEPRGFAIQLRLYTETLCADGSIRPEGGTLTSLELPSGPGVRTDTGVRVGQRTNPRFDGLLLKLIVHSGSSEFERAIAKARRALDELEIGGLRTNAALLGRVLGHASVPAHRVHTRFVEEHLAELVTEEASGEADSARSLARAGAAIDARDPLAVLDYGKSGDAAALASAPSSTITARTTDVRVDAELAHGLVALTAPLQGTIVDIDAREGDVVRPGQPVLVMSAMKMEHVVRAPTGGTLRRILVSTGDAVVAGATLAAIEPSEGTVAESYEEQSQDLDRIRPDLEEVLTRQAATHDETRPDAVARRRRTGQRTARENVAALCDPGTFVEYGGLALAAQRQRRSVEELIERTPADGMLAGIGHVNGELFDESRSRCAVAAYDYTVLAGTQGILNHRKKDRLFELAERLRLPLVIFTEGGGGRPGDTDASGVAGLDCMAFHLFGGLSGLVPLVGINSGRCFAGNAALLGCCDVVIATKGSNIGMGGPAMIEGGGLGIFRPEDVGPLRVQVQNGVVDIEAADETEAVRLARQYLSYFQGPLERWECADQKRLRAIIPENRLRIYDVRSVIETLADTGSVLELRRGFAPGMVTALARIEGRPIGIVANNPEHLAGAIDSPGADKAARFLQLCDAFDIPIVFLCDTPGIMVGPEVETTALVRHCSRMFVVGASLTVPVGTIVLRKSYGLGAQAMAGGSHKAPLFTISWPTGEFGGMGLEGAVKLGFRRELAAIEDPAERRAAFEHMVARAYERGKALNTASHFEIDDVIDPADSRHRIVSALRAAPPPPPRTGKKRPCVDTW